MRLEDRTLLLTGADGGIGQGFVHELAKQPLRRLLLGMRHPEKYTVAPPAGALPEIVPVKIDLSSYESVESSLKSLSPNDKRVDILINNAGLFEGGHLEAQDIKRDYAMFQVNLVGLVHLTARLLPQMLKRQSGQIVNNASISGYAYFPGAASYAATKAGVVAFSEALRRELRGTGVEVLHLVTPGIDTPMLSEVDQTYGRHLSRIQPEAWARKTIRAMKSGRHIVTPTGATRAAQLASRGPAWVLDLVSRGYSPR